MENLRKKRRGNFAHPHTPGPTLALVCKNLMQKSPVDIHLYYKALSLPWRAFWATSKKRQLLQIPLLIGIFKWTRAFSSCVCISKNSPVYMQPFFLIPECTSSSNMAPPGWSRVPNTPAPLRTGVRTRQSDNGACLEGNIADLSARAESTWYICMYYQKLYVSLFYGGFKKKKQILELLDLELQFKKSLCQCYWNFAKSGSFVPMTSQKESTVLV